MSDSPSTLLAKLDELKKWQEKQQERLMEQHKKRLEKNSLTLQECEYVKETLGIDVSLECVPKRNSIELNATDLLAGSKPKRAFLRRGTGLGRFRMTPGEQFKPFNKTKGSSRSSLFVPNKSNEVETIITPLKRPNLNIKPIATWHKVIDNQVPVSNIELTSELVPLNVSDNIPDNSDRELLIFETLEQRAMQNSFCSTNSSIIRLLSSTPQKNPNPQYEASTPSIREIEEVLEENVKTIESNATQLQEIKAYEHKLQNEYLSLIEKAIKFKRYVAEEESSSENSCESTLRENNFDDDGDDVKWSDSESCTSESSSKSVSSGLCSKCDATTMTDDYVKGDRLLEDKVTELEAQLKAIHVELKKSGKLKSQLDQQRREVEKRKKEIEDEKVRMNFTLEEERKKLAKEKMVFERYVKDYQNKPSKKERDEITLLKTEVSVVKETLKLKETKNGTTQARLRNQIKSLEKENATLKTDIEKLNRQNGKLVASQKVARNSSDTKMLHEINKNLTKLAQDQLNKRSFEKEKSFEFERNTANKDEEKSRDGFKTTTKKYQMEFGTKENDKNVINLELERRDSYEMYEKLLDGSREETKNNDRVEKILDDGSKQIEYNNGNLKTISPDGNCILLKYFNGDLKETNLLEGTIKYCYYESKVKHTTQADGTELMEFPDGQIERRLQSGESEIKYPNGVMRRTLVGGGEEVYYPDGTTVTTLKDGERILSLPNGQKEVHTNEHKRREYPDGTIKILYPDGMQETRYVNGRIRLKDKNGKLLMDSQESDVLDV